jgi:hypothetical protein
MFLNKWVKSRNDIPISSNRISSGRIIQDSQPKGFKPKMRGHKLRNGVHWQGVLKKKRYKIGGA